jgi:hypothetical protein
MATLKLTPTDLARFDEEYPEIDLEGITELPDPFAHIDWNDDDPRAAILDVFADPMNLVLTCKELLGVDLQPFQHVILMEMWNKPFVNLVGVRGGSKSFLLGLFIVLKSLLDPGIKIAVVAVGLRQSKNLFDYVDNFWKNAPLLREIANKGDGCKSERDKFVYKFLDSITNFLPLGTGNTIRGIRASLIIIDEYGDVPKTIIDTVVRGFASTSKDPSGKSKMAARIKKLRRKGVTSADLDELDKMVHAANQIIKAGTAKFAFNHFAQEWEKNRKIILSRGNKEHLKTLISKDSVDTVDPSQISIIRMPYTLMPEGFINDATVHANKQDMSDAVFNQEYMAVFTRDTNGFFKASEIYDKCTADNAIQFEGQLIAEPFYAKLEGDPDKQYILAIDPAAVRDLAAFTIVELHPNHTRVVYCWTTNEDDYNEYKKANQYQDVGTFYQFCALRIFELMRKFNIILVCMDYQGGGRQICEHLSNDKFVVGDNVPLYPINSDHPLWNGKKLPTDDLPGRHIIEPVQFNNIDYCSRAHHGLRGDLEKCRLLFPAYNAVELAMLESQDIRSDIADGLGDCMAEIQEMKYELTIIEHTVSEAGRERWDTPEQKTDIDKKGRLTNDRETALVMANYAASRLMDKRPDMLYNPAYRNVSQNFHAKKNQQTNEMWASAPEWFRNKTSSISYRSF